MSKAKAKPAAADQSAPEAVVETVESIKGFDASLKCRGFQFVFGQTYKVEGKVVACENGIEPGKTYRLSAAGEFVEVHP